MDEEKTHSSKNDRKPWATIIRVGFELFIVFVGVWSALLAESWRERREEDRSAAAVLEAAVANLRGTADWSTAWRDTS